MPTTAAIAYSGGRLDPLFNADDALASMIRVQLKASLTLAAGTVLGEVAASPGTYGPYSSTTLTAPASAPTFGAASGSGGPLAAGVYTIGYAYRNANGTTTLSPTGTATITIGQAINVTGLGTLPAGVASVDWYISDAGETDVQFLVNNNGAGFAINAYPAGGAAGPPTANTAQASTDGTQNPSVILAYPATTDGSGNITNPSEWAGVVEATVACYTQGAFRTQDLVGLDANAVAKLGGHLIEGTVTTGIFTF